MRNTILKAAKVLTGVIIGFAVVLTAILMARSDSEMSKDLVLAYQKIGLTLDIFTIGTYIIAGLAALLVIVLSIYNLFVNPKAARNALIGVGALALIIVVSFLLATPDIDPEFVINISENVEVTPALSKQVGAGLVATYILGALSVLAIIYTWISKLIKG